MSKSSGLTRNIKVNNNFKSTFGFPNVGELQEVNTLSGPISAGTTEFNASDVQKYIDTGKWDAYGNKAKEMIYKEIARDMSQRGFDIQYNSDMKRLTASDSVNQVIISKNSKTGKWSAKNGNAGSDSHSTSSMRKVLWESSHRRK